MIEKIVKQLIEIHYQHDESDLGNEIGFVLGKELTSEQIESFISGLRHGISLSNGTHP